MRAFVIALSLVAIGTAAVVWLSRQVNLPVPASIVPVESQPAPLPVSPPEPAAEQQAPEPPSPPLAPIAPPEASVNGESRSQPDAAPAPTHEKGQSTLLEDDPETGKLIERLHKLQSDPVAREQFYRELEDSFDTIHNQQEVPAPKPPDAGQPQAKLSIYEDIFAPSAAYPVKFTKPKVREETLPLIVPVAPAASSALGSKTSVRDLVVYWSKKNNVPPELALAVVYQESRFAPNPPRGTAGEIGPMQIMPERCRAEGYPPSRLSDPEFNIWLGTKLLATYFAEEKSYARAACRYVAGPAVFERHYSQELQDYINAYAASVERYAHYFVEHA